MSNFHIPLGVNILYSDEGWDCDHESYAKFQIVSLEHKLEAT